MRFSALCGSLLAGVALLGQLTPLAAASPSQPRAFGAARGDRPRVRLDRLDLPKDLSSDRRLERTLRRLLRREAARADWGAGAGSSIEYRFAIDELELTREGNVLHVRCSAVGSLPHHRSARSHVEFGGAPERRDKLVRRVLEIVVRGVIARLSALERARRGARSSRARDHWQR